MRRGLTGAIAVLAACSAAAPEGRAAPPSCEGSERPWVAVAGSVPELAALEPLLRAELAGRGIDLRSAGDTCGPGPIATVLVSSSGQGARIVVEVNDRLTEKRVQREVDLARVPADGRPLTLAVAADELLRASWVELALASSPPPRVAVPAAVERVIAHEITPSSSRPPAAAVGASGVVESWAGGTVLYGADLRATAWLTPRLAAALRVGLREGSRTRSADGEIHAGGWVAGAGATLRVTPWARAGIDPVARLDFVGVSYQALPDAGARGAAQTGIAVVAGGGAQGWAVLAPHLRLVIDALASAPLRAVSAEDAGRGVTSIAGIGWTGGVGLDVAL